MLQVVLDGQKRRHNPMPLNRVQFDSNNNVNVVGGLTAPNLVARQGTAGPIDLSSSPSVLGTGMDLITPASIGGDGLLSLSGGNIAFQSSKIINVNKSFSSLYDNYKIILNVNGAPGYGNINLRLRSAGTDISSSTYSYSQIYFTSIVGGTRTLLTTSLVVGYAIGTPNIGTNFVIDMCSPFINQATSYNSLGGYADIAGTNIEVDHYYGTQLSTTSFDGFTLYTDNARAMNGSLRIYGYRNQ